MARKLTVDDTRFGAEHLFERPRLCGILMATLAKWSEIDYAFTQFIIELTEVNATIAVFIYTAITNDGAKSAALNELVERLLLTERHKEYLALQKQIRKKRRIRNMIAHGLWGISVSDEKILAYVDPNQHARWESVNFPRFFSRSRIHPNLKEELPEITGYSDLDLKQMYESSVQLETQVGITFDEITMEFRASRSSRA